MKTITRNVLFLVFGAALVILSTSGIVKQKVSSASDFDIQVPGAIIERNLDKLVNDHKDAVERKLFDIFPTALNTESALPIVEGFNNSKAGLPSALKPMWENSLMILGTSSEGAGIGSGFLVRIKAVNNGYLGYVLTNNHVIDGFCNLSTRDCENLFVLHDIGLNAVTGESFKTGSNVLKVKGAKLIKNNVTPDLALLEVALDDAAISFLKVAQVQLDNNYLVGKNAFAIGYPATYRRTSATQKPIENQNYIIKRWSEGTVEQVGSTQDFGDLVIHGADILPGNSGSALYNEMGTVIGVNVLLFNVRKDFDYEGGGCGNPYMTSRASVAPSMMVPYMDTVNRF